MDHADSNDDNKEEEELMGLSRYRWSRGTTYGSYNWSPAATNGPTHRVVFALFPDNSYAATGMLPFRNKTVRVSELCGDCVGQFKLPFKVR